MTKSAAISEEFEAIKTALEVLEPLQPGPRKFALDMIIARLGLVPPGEKPQAASNGQADVGAGTATTAQKTPRQFLKDKAPATDLERYICLAYYLTHFRSTSTFTSREVTKLNDEAAGQNFSNAAATATNATRQSKMLGNAGKGKKRLTLRGEELVEALPDRQKVAAIIKSKGGKKPGRRTKKK